MIGSSRARDKQSWSELGQPPLMTRSGGLGPSFVPRRSPLAAPALIPWAATAVTGLGVAGVGGAEAGAGGGRGGGWGGPGRGAGGGGGGSVCGGGGAPRGGGGGWGGGGARSAPGGGRGQRLGPPLARPPPGGGFDLPRHFAGP